jgi:hypothetical protein
MTDVEKYTIRNFEDYLYIDLHKDMTAHYVGR